MRQIIAMGGGGFSMEPDNLLLDSYIVRQSQSRRPKVCFVPTASGDAEGYVQRFYDAFGSLPCEAHHLSLFRPPTRDLESFILDMDIVYVGGGNTENLLTLWRAWGLDSVMRKAWEAGVVLAGISAGSICWFEYGITDSRPGALSPLPCLGFLPGSNCPHYDGEEQRRPAFHQMLHAGQIPSGIAADDGVALHFVDHTLHAVVSSRPGARGWQLGLSENGSVMETEIIPHYLGATV